MDTTNLELYTFYYRNGVGTDDWVVDRGNVVVVVVVDVAVDVDVGQKSLAINRGTTVAPAAL